MFTYCDLFYFYSCSLRFLFFTFPVLVDVEEIQSWYVFLFFVKMSSYRFMSLDQKDMDEKIGQIHNTAMKLVFSLIYVFYYINKKSKYWRKLSNSLRHFKAHVAVMVCFTKKWKIYILDFADVTIQLKAVSFKITCVELFDKF